MLRSRNKRHLLLRKAVKWGYAQKVTSLSELLRNADEKLFTKMRTSYHSIHQLLPPAKTSPMKLRSTHCVFALSQCNYNLYKYLRLFCDSLFVFGHLLKYFVFTLCLSLMSDGVCLLELKGLLTYFITAADTRFPTTLLRRQNSVYTYSDSITATTTRKRC